MAPDSFLFLVIVIFDDGYPQYGPLVRLGGIDDPQGVGVAWPRFPSRHYDDEIPIADKVSVPPKGDGFVDPLVHVLGPKLKARLCVHCKAWWDTYRAKHDGIYVYNARHDGMYRPKHDYIECKAWWGIFSAWHDRIQDKHRKLHTYMYNMTTSGE